MSLEFRLVPGRWVWRDVEVTYRQRFWYTHQQRYRKWAYHRIGPKTGEKWYKKRVWRTVRQRRWKTVTKKIRKEFFEPRPPQMWRHTLGINIVERHNYMSFTAQYWSLDEFLSPEEYDEIYKKLVENIEVWLGYKQYDWWFEDEPSIAHELVPFIERLLGEIEVYGPEKGGTVTFSLKYARRMIESGEWFHKETLDKWLPQIEEYEARDEK